MEERDKQLKLQLQLRDEYMEAELKMRDQNLEESLRQRDEEWKSIWEIREQELSEELRAREDAFLSNQLKRYNELLKIMKEMEDAMKKNLMQKADAFGYLYKDHQKEIRNLIKKMDKELEGALNYREKCRTERLDMINKNLIKMYSAQTMEWSVLNRSGEASKSRQPQV